MLTSISTLIYQKDHHVSRLHNWINSQLILDCNISNLRLKHPKSENDKLKSVSEISLFFNLRNGVILKKKDGVWFLLVDKSELHTAITFSIYNRFWIAIYQNVS